jgi:prevent-host-death family protein
MRLRMTNIVGHSGNMESFDVAEAKGRLSEILERVSQGEEILLTRRGKPVARVLPAVPAELPSILGAGRQDPNINHDVISGDDWWQPMPDNETKPWYE